MGVVYVSVPPPDVGTADAVEIKPNMPGDPDSPKLASRVMTYDKL